MSTSTNKHSPKNQSKKVENPSSSYNLFLQVYFWGLATTTNGYHGTQASRFPIIFSIVGCHYASTIPRNLKLFMNKLSSGIWLSQVCYPQILNLFLTDGNLVFSCLSQFYILSNRLSTVISLKIFFSCPQTLNRD